MLEIAIIIITILCLGGYSALAYHVRKGLLCDSHAPQSGDSAEKRKISVVIAVRNEEGSIRELLESLAEQEYPDYEVIVVDDGSTDRTRILAEEFWQDRQGNFRLVPAAENPHGWGPKKNALHTGISISRGEIIATTDADCRPGPRWLEEIAAHFSSEVGAVVGYSPLKFPPGIAGRLKSLEALASGVIAAAFIALGKPFMATGRNLTYRKELYFQVGGFGESGKTPAGDDDLLIQSIASQAKVIYASSRDSMVPSYPEKGGYLSRKKRHFNSARRYRPLFILLAAMVYALIAGFTALMVMGLAAGSIALLLAGLIAFQIKALLDLSLLEIGAKKLNDSFRAADMLLAELLQIPYTLILQPLSLFGKLKWRGRSL